MIVYLIGHGFVVPHFPPIKVIPPNCDLKFYVPEGQLREDFDRTYIGEIDNKEENYMALTYLSLYDGKRTVYYIWNNGEAIKDIERIPKEIKEKEEASEGVQLVEVPIHEHLLLNLSFTDINGDLGGGLKKGTKTGVLTRELKELETFKGHPFKVLLVQNVIVPGLEFPKKTAGNQYIVTSSPVTFLDEMENTAYKLSWLIGKIVELKEELRLPEEDIHICWLACRYAMEGRDTADFFTKYKPADGDTCEIKRIYPE